MQYHLLLWKMYEICTNVLDSHHTIPPLTHTQGFFITQGSKFSSSARSGLIYQGRDKRLTPGWTSSSMADVDHGGTPRADPLTNPPLSKPCDMNYPTRPADCWQDRVLMNYGHTCSTCLREPLDSCRNTHGYTSSQSLDTSHWNLHKDL